MMSNKHIAVAIALFILAVSISLVGAASNTAPSNTTPSNTTPIKLDGIPPDVPALPTKVTAASEPNNGPILNRPVFVALGGLYNIKGFDVVYLYPAHISETNPDSGSGGSETPIGWAFITPNLKNKFEVYTTLNSAYWNKKPVVVFFNRGYIVGALEWRKFIEMEFTYEPIPKPHLI